MRVFITGGSGFLGSSIIPDLISSGHTVLALSRSSSSTLALRSLGAEPLPGSLTDLETLQLGATSTDGVIHCGFIHDFTNYEESCRIDRAAIRAIGEALKGSGKPFVVSSATGMGSVLGRELTEDDFGGKMLQRPRGENEIIALELASKGVRSSVVRLAVSVHAPGDQAFVRMLLNLAKEKGVSAYVGDGSQIWPAVHRDDAARLYRLALERAEPGTILHAVEVDGGTAFKKMAELIGEKVGVPVISIKPEEVKEHFEVFPLLGYLDNPTSGRLTREKFGWEPREVGWLDDVARADY